MTAAQGEFDGFYAANFRSLVLQLTAYSGNLEQSQDHVQEAFTRALDRWDQVSQYADPAAWVRRVAWNLAKSNWRRGRTATLFLSRQREESVPEPSPDRVAVTMALSTLPLTQRRAMIMYYLADVPVVEIAELEGVPEGTVKSWLSRGRDSLADVFADYRAETAQIKPAGVSAAKASVRRRRSVRVAAAAVALVATVTAGWLLFSPSKTMPPVLTPTPTPSSSLTPSPTPSALPRGAYTDMELQKFHYSDCTKGSFGAASYMDLQGDGTYETIFSSSCKEPGTPKAKLLVIERRTTGPVLVSQIVGDVAGLGPVQVVNDGSIQVFVAATVEDHWSEAQHQLRVYRWQGGKFVQTAGATRFLPPSSDVDLKVTLSDLVFSPDGTGTMTITVRNAGPGVAPRLSITFQCTEPVRITTPGWDMAEDICSRQFGELRPGSEQRIELTFVVPPGSSHNWTIDTFGAGASTLDGTRLREPSPTDNRQLRPNIRFNP